MIIQKSILEALLSSWRRRVSDNTQSSDYLCAVGECIYDLENLISNTPDEQEFIQDVISRLPPPEVEEYFKELEADRELSTMEAHEIAI